MKPMEPKEERIRKLEAGDGRQYILNENYEVYEKEGEPVGTTLHYHNFYEIIYVMQGEFSALAGDRIYQLKGGDFLLIGRNVMHRYQPVEEGPGRSRRIIVWISDGMLERLGGGEMNLAECFQGGDARVCHFPVYYEELLRGYLLKLAMSGGIGQEPPGARQVMDRGYLILFFSYLNLLCRAGGYYSQEGLERNPLVEQVGDYIDAHLEEKITLETLAAGAHMSKYYFLRKFKAATGVTVHTFLIHKRLIRACQWLRDGLSVTQVWQGCGFSDYSSFLRNFKAVYGVAPGKYAGFYPDGVPDRSGSPGGFLQPGSEILDTPT